MTRKEAFDVLIHVDLSKFTEEEQEALILAVKSLRVVYCNDCWKRHTWYCPSYMKQVPSKDCTCGKEFI